MVVVVDDDFDHRGTDGGGGGGSSSFVVLLTTTAAKLYMTTASMMIKIPSSFFGVSRWNVLIEIYPTSLSLSLSHSLCVCRRWIEMTTMLSSQRLRSRSRNKKMADLELIVQIS